MSANVGFRRLAVAAPLVRPADVLGNTASIIEAMGACEDTCIELAISPALAVTGAQRLAALPDVPTMSELGMQNVDAVSWFSIMAPAATPQPVMSVLRDAMRTAMSDPEVADRLDNFGAIVADVDPDQAEAFIEQERARWTRVLETAKLSAPSTNP